MLNLITQLISSAILAFGAWMGLYSMLKPSWGSKTVGLIPLPGHAEGPSEFRATFGGLFFFGHLVTLILLWKLDQLSAPIVTCPLAACWIGSGIGRMISIWRDEGTATRLNWIWVGFEMGMGILIALPFLVLLKLVHFIG
ncbi:MAG: hypothetical protein CMK09_05465 [Ponticaulis sp.]|nr:hypothetical protein [Ponticaulis sp.]|tara:strand:- start:203 stop:622 length:420 start_codon:yes stop_codon:yes gene_type:complete